MDEQVPEIGIQQQQQDPAVHVAAGSESQSLASNSNSNSENESASKNKRLCRHPGCSRVIKSQGHCQRHGAKAKRCKIDGCEKQAQGTHDGMCKRHWRALNHPTAAVSAAEAASVQPPEPSGESVYDSVLPRSISYRPGIVPTTDPTEEVKTGIMPLVTFLRDGMVRPVGWHRNAERRSRGQFPLTSLSVQLEPWERQLALVEILLLSGGTPYANFKHLAHAWGREKGFHTVLAGSICERRGEVQRKRRSDAGRPPSAVKPPPPVAKPPASAADSYAAAALASTAAVAQVQSSMASAAAIAAAAEGEAAETNAAEDSKLPAEGLKPNKRQKLDEAEDENVSNDVGDIMFTFESPLRDETVDALTSTV